jgi:hypothetical protein
MALSKNQVEGDLKMHISLRAAVAALAFACMAASSSASDRCIDRQGVTALQVASVQQQLMVAALTCGDIARYNRFVRAYQSELQTSDAALLAFFVRHGGTAEYHSFKTKLANAASLRSSMESESFCGQANAAFDEALERDSNLAGFVATQPVAFRMPYRTCDDDMTSASATPDRSHRHTKSRHRTMRISDDSNNDGDQVGRKTAWVAPRGNGGNLADADR